MKFQVVSRQAFDAAKFTAATGFATRHKPQAFNSSDDAVPQGQAARPAACEAAGRTPRVSYPGEVLTVVAKWDGGWNTAVADPGIQGELPAVAQPAFLPVTSGPYVWHCHIVDHEDNEMMRPVLVLP